MKISDEELDILNKFARMAISRKESNKLAYIIAELKMARVVIEDAIDYTTERQYQNVSACRKDLDKRENKLIASIHKYQVFSNDKDLS